MDKTYEIIIVDDHPVVRQGLARLIEQEADLKVVSEAGDAEEAVRMIAAKEYDLAVVDVSLQGVSGLELVKRLRDLKPDLPVLMLSMHHERFYAQRALRAGAQGYIMKQKAPTDIVTAVRRVLGGELYLSRELADEMLRRAVDGKPGPAVPTADQLSDRELEVLQMIGQGVSTREIADALNLSVKTIESYRANIKRKLSLSNAAELMRYAFEWTQVANGQG